MDQKRDKHPSVGKTHEIDRKAVNIFLNWLPGGWLPRKQDPDYFVDFLVEIVENGEPTGLHFAAQIKGFEEGLQNPKKLSYPFKTKHLVYYRDRVQHPVFLFLINTSSGEGYWFFAQKFLKENVHSGVLEHQDSFTIHFLKDDDLLNLTKFRCLLPEAEKFVRDLHPGTLHAALEKRKMELESMDPRCSVSISILNGKEHVEISPNEEITFTTNIQGPNEEAWRDFFEKGSKLKIKREDFQSTGFPLFKEILKNIGDEIQIQCGKEIPGSIQITDKAEAGKVIPINGTFRSGAKFFIFQGLFPDSPFSISFEVSREAAIKGDSFDIAMSFEPRKWHGQPILTLAYFDQIVALMDALTSKSAPEMELFLRGNSFMKGGFGDGTKEIGGCILKPLEWFKKCRWLAKHFSVNPLLPELEKFGKSKIKILDQVYDLLTRVGRTVPAPGVKLVFTGEKQLSDAEIESSDNILRIDRTEQTFDFFGVAIRVQATREIFTEMELVSQNKLDDGSIRVVLQGTNNTKLTSNWIELK